MLSAKAIGLGGGGALFHPRVSPFDVNLMFVACDMLAIYRTTNGGTTWEMCDTRDVHGSPRFSVAFDPGNANHVVGYHRLRGVRDSIDQGVTWSDFTPQFPDVVNNLELTAAAFSSTGEVLFGTNKGLYRNIAGTWTQVLPLADIVDENVPNYGMVSSGEVLRIVFVKDHIGRELCCVATLKHIYQCDIAGNTWVDITGSLPLAANPGPTVSFFDNNGALYVASRIRSFAGSYQPTQSYVLYVALAGSQGNVVGAVTQFTGGVFRYFVDAVTAGQWLPAMGSGTLKLDDAVVTSGPNPDGTPIPRYEQLATTEQVATASTPDPVTVYVSVIKARGDTDVYRSIDRGASWVPTCKGKQQAGTNVDGGWLDKETLNTAQPPGVYGGLGWGFGGAAKGLSCAPSNSSVVVFTNNGVVHRTATGGVGATPPDWFQKYTTITTQAGNTRWQTSGVEVTSTWHYFIDPNQPSVHFICATDIGLCRSDDGAGENWVSVSEAKASKTSATLQVAPLPSLGKGAIVKPGAQIVFSYVAPVSGGHSSKIALPFYLAPVLCRIAGPNLAEGQQPNQPEKPTEKKGN